MRKTVWGLSLVAGVVLFASGCAAQRIAISTDPANAAVTVDEEYVGDSPVVIKVSDKAEDAGKMYVRVAKQGYSPTMRVVNKDPAWPEKVQITLEKISPGADVDIKTRGKSDTDVNVRPK